VRVVDKQQADSTWPVRPRQATAALCGESERIFYGWVGEKPSAVRWALLAASVLLLLFGLGDYFLLADLLLADFLGHFLGRNFFLGDFLLGLLLRYHFTNLQRIVKEYLKTVNLKKFPVNELNANLSPYFELFWASGAQTRRL
jgi:hypothetical protein